MKATDPTPPNRPAPRRSRQVPYSDALIIGMIAAAVVLLSTIIFTRAWQSMLALGLCVLYSAIAFVVVGGSSMLLNRLVRDDYQDDKDYPVLD